MTVGPDPRLGARSIETDADVEQVLESGKFSGIEALQCLELARRSGNADLLGRVGVAVLEHGANVPRHLIPALDEAAKSIVMRYLFAVSTLDRTDAALHEAAQLLERVRSGHSGLAADAATGQIKWIDEVRMLLADDHPVSLVKVCKLMREVYKPDLGVQAATQALDIEPNNPAALTTRAAAHLDLGNAPRAMTDAKKAWAQKPSPFVAPVYIRALVLSGVPERGIALAEEAFDRWPDNKGATALALLGAAAQANDQDALARATEIVSGLPPADESTEDTWVVKLATRRIVDDGNPDLAERVVNQLTESGRLGEGDIRDLQRRIRIARREKQQSLGLDGGAEESH